MPLSYSRLCLAFAFVVACGYESAKVPDASSLHAGPDAGLQHDRDPASAGPTTRDAAANASAPDDAAAQRGHDDFAVGTVRVELAAAGGRRLPLQLWYPAVEAARTEAEAGRAVLDFEPEGKHRDQLGSLLEKAPEPCTSKLMHAANAPALAPTNAAYPLLVFSHCLECVRFSSFSIAEHLASLGFVVAAPDHVDNTMYDKLDGTSVGLTSEFLKTRAADVKSVIDALLDAESDVVPADMRGHIDAERIGVFGHSYGSVTTGLVLQDDARVKAGVMIAAPPESPLLSGASIAKITQPALFLLAQEDHSITEVGNIALRSNYDNFPNAAWLVEVADAGHWSFSDICAIVDGFKPGCGMDTRQTNPLASFTYLDIVEARGIATRYVSAFFRAQLLGDASAASALGVAEPSEVVTLKHHD